MIELCGVFLIHITNLTLWVKLDCSVFVIYYHL